MPPSTVPVARRIRERYLRMFATLQRAKVTGELSDRAIAIAEARLRVWAAQRALAAIVTSTRLALSGGGARRQVRSQRDSAPTRCQAACTADLDENSGNRTGR